MSSIRSPRHPASAIRSVCWTLLFCGVFAWAASRLGAFTWWTTVRVDGVLVRLPAAFGRVDHPFHTIRAEQLLDAWRHLDSLRWVYEHQGGYPAEFYPFGAAALDVVGWLLTFGALPMAIVHKLVVIAVFFAPALGFGLLSRRAGLSTGAAFVATAAQLAVRGWWWSGGSYELIEWGMITNVAAATALVIALPLLADAGLRERRRDAAAAAALAAFALYTNPRSFIALGAVGAGCLLTCWLAKRSRHERARTTAWLVGAGGVAALISAPEWIALLRYNSLYYFVRYSWYHNLHEYWKSSITAVSTPVFVIGLIGIAHGLVRPRHAVVRAAALSLVIYVGATAYFVLGAWPSSFAQQLETTRLMPFQRLLWLALAGYGAFVLIDSAAGAARRWAADAALAAVGVLLLVAYVIAPIHAVPVSDRGLVKMPTAAQPGIADLEIAVKSADQAAPPGAALLIIGTTFSWHDQMWSAQWTTRPLFFNDWLWYWQTKNYGVYDPTAEHDYPDPSTALTADYLSHHGIGAVVVTGVASEAAAASPLLASVRQGVYGVYVVKRPTSIVTFGSVNAPSVKISADEIDASGTSDGSPIIVRRNWFPRWAATINGESVRVTQTADGYMQISAPAGSSVVKLRYVLDRWDWLARILAACGILVMICMLAPARWVTPIVRRARR